MSVKLNTISVSVRIPNVTVSGTAARRPIKFYTTAGVTTYQGANWLGIGYVADLARLQGKTKDNIDSIERQSNNVIPDRYEYADNTGFTFVGGGDVEDREYVVINFH